MTVYELNRDQLEELKQRYYSDVLLEEEDRTPSYYELSNIDDYVSDQTVFDEYDNDTFVNDDFFCTAGQPEEEKTYHFECDDLYGTDQEIADDLREIARGIENDYAWGITSRGTNWAISKE